VQRTLQKLFSKLICGKAFEVAPLSSQFLGKAVSSSTGDAFSLMQTTSPRMHNEFETPGWYPFEGVAPHDDALSEAESSSQPSEDEDDPEQDENDDPEDDPEPQPPEVTNDRQSAIMFHLRDNPIHAMLNWVDFGIMMHEIAYHYGMDREDVIECHEVRVPPPDIPHGCSPLIIQMVRDIPVGDCCGPHFAGH